jgi:3-oxoadipate enol-lactonase
MSATTIVDGRERRGEFVESGGERIYAEITGQGDAIVLCHGLGGNHAIWWRQVDALAGEHTLVTWDQRGFGNSTARSGAVGIDEAVEDLRALLDALGIERAHLVGQSMGAFVTLRFALGSPDRVRSLVLSTTLAAADPDRSRALGGAVPSRQLRDRHPVVSESFSRAHPDLVVLYNQIASFGEKPPSLQMLEYMAQQDFGDEELAGFDRPVLVLAAEHDTFCPPDILEATAARFPSATFEVIAGAEHSAYYERPEAWNEQVLRFIALA